MANFKRFLRPALPALLDEDFLMTAEKFLLDNNKEGSEPDQSILARCHAHDDGHRTRGGY